MPFRMTTHDIALILMAAGVVSLVLHEPLARLDSLLVKGGPFRLEQGRDRLSRRLIIAVGIALMALALALVVR